MTKIKENIKMYIGEDPKDFFYIKDHPIIEDAKNEFGYLNEEYTRFFGHNNKLEDLVLTIATNDQSIDFYNFMIRHKLKVVNIKNYYYDTFKDEEIKDIIVLHFNFINNSYSKKSKA